MTAQEAKIQAKVAKAQAKAMRKWWQKKRFWVLGLFGLFIVLIIAFVVSAGTAIDDAVNKQHTVVYSVYGNGVAGNGVAGSITYANFSNGQFGESQQSNTPLPWSKTVLVKGLFTASSVIAQLETGSSITCKVTVDGTVVSTNTSQGQYVAVTCGG